MLDTNDAFSNNVGFHVEVGLSITSTRYKEDVVVLKKNPSLLPLMNIELKTRVSQRFGSNPLDEIVEVLVCCYYLMKLNSLTTLACALTDANIWHIFQCKYVAKNDNLKVIKYYTINTLSVKDKVLYLHAIFNDFFINQ